GFHSAHKLVALADADNLAAWLGHTNLCELIDEDPVRPLVIDRNRNKTAGLINLVDDIDDLADILELVIHDGQLASVGKILQLTCDRFAPLEHALMTPRVRPRQPPARIFLASKKSQAEEVV